MDVHMCLRHLFVITNHEEEKMALLFEYTTMWWLHLDQVLSVIYYIFSGITFLHISQLIG